MRIKTAVKYLLAAIAVAGILSPLAVMAQSNSTTLTVSPPLFELSANPGDTLKNSIRLENPSNKPLAVDVEFRNFTANGEEGSVNLTSDSGRYSLASWLSIDSKTAVVPAQNSHTFTFYVSVPANAEPGGHFGSIVFKTKPDTSATQDQSGAKVQQEIASLLLVKVSGDIKESLSVASFGADHSLWEKGPVLFDTRIKNDGNVHVKPTGTITISRALTGKTVATLQLDEKNILPGAIRKLTSTWSPSGFTFGRYTAHLSIVYGSQNKILSATATFWVIPYRLITLILVVLILLGAVIVRYRKRIAAASRVLRGKS